MLKIPLGSLESLFQKIAEDRPLYLPISRAGATNFERWQRGAAADLGSLPVKSCKDLFFPQSEDLMRFRLEGKSIELEAQAPSAEPFAIFGVRGCDVRSIATLDCVFLEEPVDTYYQARRNAATIVSLGCLHPLSESCFCAAFGLDLAEPAGDARAWLADDALYLEAVSEKGGVLLEGLEGEVVPDELLDAAKEHARAQMAENPLVNLDLSGFSEERTLELFESPAWKKLSQACLGCGACTFVCPTCQCYDIRDFDTGNGVQRFRCWDSCMYSDFTMMAHGNSRKTQLERFRQRFMHKLNYFPANHGAFMCVGCGRCVERCPMHLNIVKVIRTLGEVRT